jgi:hypothetical protein
MKGKGMSFSCFTLDVFQNFRGIGLTSEEITAKRRAERKQFKLDRAKAMAAAAAEAEATFKEEGRVIAPGIAPDGSRIIPSAATWKPTSVSVPSEEAPSDDVPDELQEEIEPIQDLEHLQLSLQEAFFLVWALDCLTVLHPETVSTPSYPLLELVHLISSRRMSLLPSQKFGVRSKMRIHHH